MSNPEAAAEKPGDNYPGASPHPHASLAQSLVALFAETFELPVEDFKATWQSLADVADGDLIRVTIDFTLN